MMHRVKFLEGDVYHMLGASQSAAEDAAYAEAENIRRAILKSEICFFSSFDRSRT